MSGSLARRRWRRAWCTGLPPQPWLLPPSGLWARGDLFVHQKHQVLVEARKRLRERGLQAQVMQVGSLYEMAVDLNPRAARIAAECLAGDPALPENLRCALRMALLRAGKDEAVGAKGLTAECDAQAAAAFVIACRKVCGSD